MGNHSSSQAADLPDGYDQFRDIMEGNHSLSTNFKDDASTLDITTDDIEQIVAEAIHGKHGKRRSLKTKKTKKLGRSVTLDAPPKRRQSKSEGKSGKKKSLPVGRSITDSSIEQVWEEQKKKRSSFLKKKRHSHKDIRSEMDPQKVLELLEHYSDVDQKLAEHFMSSLQRPTSSKAGGVPKAA